MNKNNYIIGISCIGSGVGQSVINSLRLSKLPIKTVGLGTNPFAYGAYDCDTYDYTKSIYDEGFIDDLIDKCIKHKIDLVIPGLDDEALLYAQNAVKFEKAGIKAIYSDEALISICRDKERMSHELNEIVDVFVKSYNKETLSEDIATGKVKFPFIAKPRGGFASRGVEIIRSEDDLTKITDDHIIQELAIPVKDDPNFKFYMAQIAKNRNPQVSEISIQIVYSPKGELMGRMFSYNKLNNGVPIEIVPYENDYIWSVVDQLTPTLLKMGLRGPLNIQGRLTEEGLKLFEMNPRFTGITGLRALMGFNEVEACVKEWLGIDKGKNKLRFNYNRFGIRQTADKSIPIERNQEVESFSKLINGKILKPKKTVLITGACGYLGQNLINKLAISNEFNVWAFDLDKEKLKTLHAGKVEQLYNTDDLNSGEVQLGNVDILLHLGFTRPHGTNEQIAQSLQFTNELFVRAVMHHVPAIINISSQSVYGQQKEISWRENIPVAPKTVYAQAKYATEILLESLTKFYNTTKYTSLRLGTLIGGMNGLVDVDVISKFVKQSLNGKELTVYPNANLIQRLDIRDAIIAIIKILKSNPTIWKMLYNVGNSKSFELDYLANMINTISVSYISNFGKPDNSKIDFKENLNFKKNGINSERFERDFNWSPKYSIEESINSLFHYISEGNN